ncbi:holo-ACP synthase [Blattabacterium cuenoti]|uniref:hypothetical protein n=1 Tax=Blattabacterium cuenoti TaxID=1653831 RepID=UPI001EE9E39E|nr:hypothetical protein [Blattabacterium cuenoti]
MFLYTNKFTNIHTTIIVFKWGHLKKTMFLEKFILSDQERRFFFSLSEKRKKEFLGVRYALKYIGINMNIFYNKKRKPFLYDGVLGKKKSIFH